MYVHFDMLSIYIAVVKFYLRLLSCIFFVFFSCPFQDRNTRKLRDAELPHGVKVYFCELRDYIIFHTFHPRVSRTSLRYSYAQHTHYLAQQALS